jgi:hypothetical protein
MRSRLPRWIGTAAIAASAISVGCQSRDAEVVNAPPPAAEVAPPVSEPAQSTIVQFTAPPPAYTGELPPLPNSPFEPPRPPDVVKAVYTFAARHPEVLHYVPCFCGCQRSGHKDNDDCFIQSRDGKGRPTWEAHGMT